MTAERPVRPVDAAGLVLIRDRGRGPELLVGRRHSRVPFLPDIYVFPGGRIDAADRAASGFHERLHPLVEAQLRRARGGRSGATFARAAIRETFEETGLLVGVATAAPRQGLGSGVWHAFAAAGTAPAFHALDFVCRAITPSYSKRRYDTRFFLADGELAGGDLGGSGELLDLGWRTLPELRGLGLVDVTQFVLREALRRWRAKLPPGAEPGRLYCYKGDAARWRAGPGGAWQTPTEGF
jgi:8-oxo-dGTP pyrophosphatase MutT (NUDIX family)